MKKTALTFEEQITAAHLHYVQGIDQHVIAFAMGVNMGRVNEACVAIRKALGHFKPGEEA
jgi:DNA-binding transcriptional regulator LsrR (DeoR family)